MTQSPTRRTQAERSKASREKIIREATKFFAQNGFRGTKLSDIAKAVDMSEPGLLHHFPSKNHLLISVLEERDRADRQRYVNAKEENDLDVIAAIRELVTHNETVPGLVKLFTVLVAESITADNPGHEFFVKRYQGLREIGNELIKKSQEKGEIRDDIGAEDLIVMIFAMMDGLQIQWLLEPKSVQMSKFINIFLDFLRPAGNKE